MGLLEGKNALVFGLANDKSIAWGITQAFKREGANIGISYAGEMLETPRKTAGRKSGLQMGRRMRCDKGRTDHSRRLRRPRNILARSIFWCIRLHSQDVMN